MNYCPAPTQPRRLPLNSQLHLSHPRMRGCEISDCFTAPIGAIFESSSLPVMAMEAVN